MRSLLFVIESGTDIRMIEGLARRFDLEIVFRKAKGGREINHPFRGKITSNAGPSSRVAFFFWLFGYLIRRTQKIELVLVQGYGLSALTCNLVARLLTNTPTLMMVCSPMEAYLRCRIQEEGSLQLKVALVVLHVVAVINARIARGYVVLSDYLGEVVRVHGTRAAIYRVPIYGVDTSIFRPLGNGESRCELRIRRRLPEEGRIIFFSSRIAPEKDAATVLAAFRKLRDRGRSLAASSKRRIYSVCGEGA